MYTRYIVPLHMKGCICHFIKRQIHPFISKGATCRKCGVFTWSQRLSWSSMPHLLSQFYVMLCLQHSNFMIIYAPTKKWSRFTKINSVFYHLVDCARSANTRPWNNVILMLGQPRRRWPNIKTTLFRRPMSAGWRIPQFISFSSTKSPMCSVTLPT